jgi:hypothetical protein
MPRYTLAAAALLSAGAVAYAQSPQPSPQRQLQTPPANPVCSPPPAQFAAPVQMATPGVYPNNLVIQQQPVAAAPSIMVVAAPAPAPLFQCFQQPVAAPVTTAYAMRAANPRTVQWGPGPIGASIAWLGRAVQPLGRAHTWTIQHSVLQPLSPVVAPAATPTIFVATQPAPQPYQYVPMTAVAPQQTVYYATPTPAAAPVAPATPPPATKMEPIIPAPPTKTDPASPPPATPGLVVPPPPGARVSDEAPPAKPTPSPQARSAKTDGETKPARYKIFKWDGFGNKSDE